MVLPDLQAFFDKTLTAPKKAETEYQTLSFEDNPYIVKDLFRKKINNIQNMPDGELIELIRGNLNSIVDDINDNDSAYIGAITNTKFLGCFLQVIKTTKDITPSTKVCCNKLAYDYFTLDTPTDTTIKDMLYQLSRIVNKDNIIQLTAIGLDVHTASSLSIARYSSFKDPTNVKRLNFEIEQGSAKVMTEQMIVWIYEKLFDYFTVLFEASMFEVYTQEQEDLMPHDFGDIYSTIDLALLTILNNMPYNNICSVLRSYAESWNFLGKPQVRFHIYSISMEFSRVTAAYKEITAEGNIIP